MRGHRAAAISLTYDDSGTLLASCGADSDIFVWDVVNLSGSCFCVVLILNSLIGKYKLRSHKDAVTGCVFVPSTSSSTPKYLISCSKDTLVKVWDMSTQHCIQTIVGHRCEIWSIALVPLPTTPIHDSNSNEVSVPDQNYLILTGSSDDMIRGYTLRGEGSTLENQNNLGDDVEVLDYVGSIQSQGGEKCTG